MDRAKSKLIEEKDLLDVKIERLENFFTTDTFKTLSGDAISLLNIQLPIMRAYSQILLERIVKFN